jgi:ubiquinone/menaquinone biosynthesis C-methylase UbiE
MNLLHRWICRSAYWKRSVETELLPWGLQGVEPGTDALEIGPGYGATTDLLRSHVPRLTCVEIDGELARLISRRSDGTNVRIIQADAAYMPLQDASFSSALCFTMLHHMRSAALQDRLLAEAARVLRPGGTFAGTDSLSSAVFRLIHINDTLVAVDPNTFPERLRAAGFIDIHVDVAPRAFRFRATRKGRV